MSLVLLNELPNCKRKHLAAKRSAHQQVAGVRGRCELLEVPAFHSHRKKGLQYSWRNLGCTSIMFCYTFSHMGVSNNGGAPKPLVSLLKVIMFGVSWVLWMEIHILTQNLLNKIHRYTLGCQPAQGR